MATNLADKIATRASYHEWREGILIFSSGNISSLWQRSKKKKRRKKRRRIKGRETVVGADEEASEKHRNHTEQEP